MMETNPLQQELDRRRGRGDEVIDLVDSNFHRNGHRFPESVLAGLFSDYLRNRSYAPEPKGDRRAREAISEFYRHSGVPIDADSILITASTSESYSLLFTSLADGGDNILLPRPTYPLFEYLAELSRLEVRYYDMPRAHRFAIDPDSVAAQIDGRTRFLVIISPSNPTGRISTEDELASALALCDGQKISLVFDEVFSEFRYAGSPQSRSGSLPRPAGLAASVPVFTLNGISKMFACPDLKLAWIAATGPARLLSPAMDRLEIANDTFLNCSSLSQSILPGLFAEGGSFTSGMVTEVDAGRRLLLESLSSAGPAVRVVEPVGGIHCVLDIDARGRFADDEDFAVSLLRETGVYLHPGYFYGMDDEGDGRVRAVVTFLKERRALARGLSLMKAFLSDGRSRSSDRRS